MVTSFNNEVDTFALPQAGVYTLAVEGRVYDGGASGNYAFNLLPVTYPTNALTIGATISGTVSTLGQRRCYTFPPGAAADPLFHPLTHRDISLGRGAPRGAAAQWCRFAAR